MSLTLPRQLRSVLSLMVAVALIGLWTIASTERAHATPTFTLFDDTSYNDANLQANYGLTPAAVVYDSWSISCSNLTTFTCHLPTQADFQAKIKALDATIPSTSPLVLDFEGIDGTSGTPIEQATNDFRAWQQLIGWVRAVIPASQPLGTYSYDWDMSSAEITNETSLHQQGLTFFAPSLYSYTADLTGADWTSWTNRVAGSLANDQQIAPGQPVYPYIWAQWDTGKNAFVDGGSWSQELSYLQAHTAGAIMWSGDADITDPTGASCGWIGATHNFMTGLTGTGGSTGALTATAQFPDNCVLPRGQSTTVPLTLTNSGATTSTATTLSVSGPSGTSGVPDSTAVPALAPNATWSTEVQLAVGSGTSPGDQVITFSLAGEGVQHRTVLIDDADLAQGMTATQSSTNGTDGASRAVDGDTDSAVADGSVSQTGTDAKAWWQVDLGSTKNIGAVAVWGSNANPGTANYYLVVSNSATATAPTTPIPPNQWTQTSSGVWAMNVTRSSFRYDQYLADASFRGPASPTVVPAGVSGRYVRVQLVGNGPLSLAEVQVRPYAPDSPVVPDTQRLANSGFENGSLAPWTAGGTVSLTAAAALSGNYGASMGVGAGVTQTITVQPNTTYTLTGFAEPSNSGNAVEIGVKNYGGSQLVYYTSTPSWSQGTVTFTTGASNTTAQIFCYHDVGSGTASCDNLSVVTG